MTQFACFRENSEQDATGLTSTALNNLTEERPSPNAFCFPHQHHSPPVELDHELNYLTYKKLDWKLTKKDE